MSRKTGFLTGLVLVVLLSGTVYAQGPDTQHSDPNWQISYWNNMSLSGPPIRQVINDEIDWDWRTGSPHAAINPDHFSVRWTRYIDLASDTYRFTATSDDGIRVYVDNRLIIDEWTDHPSRTYTADISLVAGHHLVMVEYYENTGHAMAQLSWAPASVPPDKWQGEYYARPVWAADAGSLRVAIPPADPTAQPLQPTTIWYLPTDGTSASLMDSIVVDGQPKFSPDMKYLAYLEQPEGAKPGHTQGKLIVRALVDGKTVAQYPQAIDIYGWSSDSQYDVRGSPGFRDGLGWALAPEFGYEAVFHCDDALPSGGRSWQTCYLAGSDGEVIVFHPLGGWYLLGERKDQEQQ